MDNKILKIIAGVIFMLAAISIWQAIEAYPGITEINGKIADQNEINTESENTLLKVKEFADFSVKNKEAIEKFDFIMPSNEDKANLLSVFEALASNNGLNTLKISFADEDIAGAAKSDKQPGGEKSNFEAKSVTVLLRGSYSSFKNFLLTIQNDLRIMDVVSINFGKANKEGKDSGPAEYDYDIKFKTYFYKPLAESDINKILGNDNFKSFAASDLGFINKKSFNDLVLPADYNVSAEDAEIGNQNIF